MMSRITFILIRRNLNGNNPTGAMHDWIALDSEGDFLFEGFSYPTKRELEHAIRATYTGKTWDLKKHRDGTFSIDPN